MIPRTIEELERIKEDAKKLSTKAAVLSAGGSVIPVPAADVGVDIGLLLKTLPEINRKFGLSPDQIDALDPYLKQMVLEIIKKSGAKLAGKIITKELIIQVLKKLGVRVTAKQVAKYIPIIGQMTSAAISFCAMKLVLNSHINECYKICKEIIENQTK